MKKTIRETMPNLLTTGGIFKTLPLYGDMTAVQMGIAYCLKRSGNKCVTSFVDYYLNDNGVLDANSEEAIGLILNNVFKENWDARWNVLHQEYNPIQNTDKDITTTITHSGTDEFVMGATHVESENKSATNVSTYDDGNKTIADGDEAINSTIHGHVETTHEVGGGNIGTMTSQYLLSEELKLRVYNFYEEMFKDIDEYLCLPIFGKSHNYGSSQPLTINDVKITQVANGIKISIGNESGVVQNGANGLTPELSLESNGDLYVEYKER